MSQDPAPYEIPDSPIPLCAYCGAEVSDAHPEVTARGLPVICPRCFDVVETVRDLLD